MTDLEILGGKYPRKGCTTVIDTNNLYEGYFANHMPGTTRYSFVVEPGWKVTYARSVGLGTHGCKQGNAVVHIVVERISPIAEAKEYPIIVIIGVFALLAYLMLK